MNLKSSSCSVHRSKLLLTIVCLIPESHGPNPKQNSKHSLTVTSEWITQEPAKRPQDDAEGIQKSRNPREKNAEP